MPLAKEQFAAREYLVPPAVKDFMGSFELGRLGLRAGRKIVRTMQAFRLRRKCCMRQFGLPLRNAILLNRPLRVSFEGIPIRLVPRGHVASLLWTGLDFEKHEISFVLSVLKPGMIFFDVGANAGLFAISAAKKIGGKGVFAFEPCSSTFELLKQNLQLNRLTDVNVVQMALGESVGEGVLQVNARGKDGLNTLGQATHPDSKVVGQEDVRITTADAFIMKHNVSRVDLIKVDIEGAELMFFRGARDLLQRSDAPLILYEGFGSLTRGFGYHPVEILWFLEACGYTLFLLNSDTGKISDLEPDYQYDSMVIAVKPGHAAFEDLRARLQ
jgi:FkbM family methyltransferase